MIRSPPIVPHGTARPRHLDGGYLARPDGRVRGRSGTTLSSRALPDLTNCPEAKPPSPRASLTPSQPSSTIPKAERLPGIGCMRYGRRAHVPGGGVGPPRPERVRALAGRTRRNEEARRPCGRRAHSRVALSSQEATSNEAPAAGTHLWPGWAQAPGRPSPHWAAAYGVFTRIRNAVTSARCSLVCRIPSTAWRRKLMPTRAWAAR
jgi:hypothetical protein